VSAADLVALAERWTAADNAADFSRHAEWMGPDTEVHLVARNLVLRGPVQYEAFLRAYLAGVPDLYAEIHDRFATDDRLAHRWVMTGTHSGELFGVPPTGRSVRFEGASVWECRNGRPERIFIYIDPGSLTAQLQSSGGDT
jgi:steroid delta-isomerase-like uncharacterized protein